MVRLVSASLKPPVQHEPRTFLLILLATIWQISFIPTMPIVLLVSFLVVTDIYLFVYTIRLRLACVFVYWAHPAGYTSTKNSNLFIPHEILGAGVRQIGQ